LLSLAFDERLLLAIVKNTSEAHVEIVLSDGPDGATVEVTDHGGTIPEADLRMIDEEIERQDRHLQGVGLWLVRWAIDYSDADLRIEAESEPRRLLIRFGS
jgi:signal transduction histidine kinase